MKYNVYCIRDDKIGFLTPTVDTNHFTAARNFANAIMQGQGVLFTHADDFRLYCIGEFDTESGQLIPHAVPELVSEGAQVLIMMNKRGAKDV